MKPRMWIALFALYIAWGTTYLAILFAMETIPPFLMSGVRFLIAGLILYVWRRLAGDPAPSRGQWRSAAIIGSFLLVGGIGGATLAEKYVPSGIASLIVAATPLWVVLIEAMRPGGSKPNRQTILGVLIGFAGMSILINPIRSAGEQSGYNLLGIGILLLAALSWAIGSVISQKMDLPKSPLLSTGMQLLVGSAGSTMVGLMMGEGRQLDLTAISLRSLAGLGYLILVGSLVGFVCYTWLLRVAPTSLVVTYAYVNPLVAVLLGSWLAQEALTPRVLIAAPLILSAVALIHLRKAKVKEPKTIPLALHASAGED